MGKSTVSRIFKAGSQRPDGSIREQDAEVTTVTKDGKTTTSEKPAK